MARPRLAATSPPTGQESDSASPEGAADVSFEDAMGELEEIVQALESEPLPLDDLVGKYERGMSLLRQCRRQIDSAQLRIEQITRRGDDAVITVPVSQSVSAPSSFPSAEPVSPSPQAAIPSSNVPTSTRSKPAAAASFSADDEIRLF